MENNTFSHNEKLKSHVLIENLFGQGETFRSFPFTIYYLKDNSMPRPVSQYMISVSKHYFKHAVKRNHIKRLFRETFRKNRQDLKNILNQIENRYSIAFVYQTKKFLDYQSIEKSMINALKILIEKIKQKENL